MCLLSPWNEELIPKSLEEGVDNLRHGVVTPLGNVPSQNKEFPMDSLHERVKPYVLSEVGTCLKTKDEILKMETLDEHCLIQGRLSAVTMMVFHIKHVGFRFGFPWN